MLNTEVQILSPLQSSPTSPTPLTWVSLAVIALFGGTMLSVGLGRDYRVLTAHEIINVQPAREMLATGDWIVLRIAGEPIPEAKGPLTAWLIALAMKLLGTEAEWVGRGLGVLAAIITAWLMASLAARWYGNRVGLIAGLMQISMLYIMKVARLAECDVFLMASVVGALYCFALANVDNPRGRVKSRWPVWGFFLAAGMAFLFKTLVGLVFIASACFFYILLRREWRLFRFFLSPVGWLIFALCTLPWPIAFYLIHPEFLDYVVQHYLQRAEGTLGGVKPFYYYALALPLMMLPWFPFFVLALWVGVRNGLHRQALWQYIAVWVVPALLLLSASACKYDHYLAPLLPPLSLFSALGLFHYFALRYQGQPSGYIWLIALLAVGIGTGLAVILSLQPRGYEATAWLLGITGVGTLGMLYCERQRWLRGHLVALFATVWLVAVGVFLFVFPHHDNYRSHMEFAQRVNAQVPAGQPLYLIHFPLFQQTYYLDSPLHFLHDKEEVRQQFRAGSSEVYFLAPRYFAAEFSPWGRVDLLEQSPGHETLPEKYQPYLFRLSHPRQEVLQVDSRPKKSG